MSPVAFFPTSVAEKTLDLADARDPAAPEESCAPPPGKISIEMVALDALLDLKSAWAELIQHALEPNVFLEPGFAIPLYQHCETQKNLRFLLAFSENTGASPRRLLGILPFIVPERPVSYFLRGATHKYAPLSIPLLDRDYGREALAGMIDWLRERFPLRVGLMLSHIPTQGATYALLRLYADSHQGRLYLFDEYERAALSAAKGPQTFPERFISTKKRKQHRQQRRRLGHKGEVIYRTVRDPVEMPRAADSFLSLESKGWKGARKTALLASPADATFFRAMTHLMASEGKCRIDSLDVNGMPVAMAIILESGEKALYWKTTYDERFAALSPGVQITLELTQTQLASPSISLTDSCAIPNHPMINHIWRERIAMADILLPIRRTHGLFFQIGLRQEILFRTIRGMAKFAVNRVRQQIRRRSNAAGLSDAD